MTQVSGYGGFSGPGMTAALYTQEREIIWGGSDTRLQILYKNSVIDGAIRDAGNSPTTLIRRGLLLGKITATGLQVQWDSTATDGSQFLSSINNMELRAQDFNAVNTDRVFATILQAPLLANMLLIKGVNLVGHVDEYLARRYLHQAHCVLDDDPYGYLTGLVKRFVSKSTDYTVVLADNGSQFYATGAATFTLPTLKSGLVYEFVNSADNTVAVTAADSGSVIWDGNAAVTTLTGSTGSHKIGLHLRFEANNAATKWIVSQLGPSGVTITAS